MKTAVSNIAWPSAHDAAAAAAMADAGVFFVEVAPTKIWSKPLEVSDSEIADYRRIWERQGISIVAAQSLLFGRSDLTLFDDRRTRDDTLSYLRNIIRVCAGLGAKSLVFGSPKNRRMGERDPQAVWREAVEFFSRVADYAVAAGTVVVIEANPREYGADFITCGRDALKLVREVNHAGLRLHLDTACMTLAGDLDESFFSVAAPWLAHFHVSEPYLMPIGHGVVDHRWFAGKLVDIGYKGWVSLEMQELDLFDASQFLASLKHLQRDYGGAI